MSADFDDVKKRLVAATTPEALACCIDDIERLVVGAGIGEESTMTPMFRASSFLVVRDGSLVVKGKLTYVFGREGDDMKGERIVALLAMARSMLTNVARLLSDEEIKNDAFENATRIQRLLDRAKRKTKVTLDL